MTDGQTTTMPGMVGMSNEAIYSNSSYTISKVPNKGHTDNDLFPEVYEVRNKRTGVLEAYGEVLPQLLDYAHGGDEVIRYYIDKDKPVKLDMPLH